MTRKIVLFITVSILSVVGNLCVAGDNDEVLVVEGLGETVTAGELREELNYILEKKSPLGAPSLKAVERVSGELLTNKLIRKDALEMKLDTDPAVAKEIARARDRILIKARLAKFAEVDLSPSEVTQLAKEYWLLHQDEFKEESKRSVSHILIGNKARTDDDAEKLAQELYKKLKTDPLNFEQFVAEYSDDPGSKSEKGSLGLSERGRFVPEFSQVAFSLKKVGDISEPVKTRFGYHLIRLDEIVEEKKFSFEESEKDAATKALSEYVKAKQQQYLNDLRASANRTVHEESIKALWEEMFPR